MSRQVYDIQGYLENQIMLGKHTDTDTDTDISTKDDIKCSRILNSNTNCNSVECKWAKPDYKHSRKITECVNKGKIGVWEGFYDKEAETSYVVDQHNLKNVEANWEVPYGRYNKKPNYRYDSDSDDDVYTSGKTTGESKGSFSPKSSAKYSAKYGGRIQKRKTYKFSKKSKSKSKKSRKHPNKKSLRRHPKKSRKH
jgi:hypothetical protein